MHAASTIPTHFLEKRYYSWNNHLREVFGEKVFRVAIAGGFTCPNREGIRANFSRPDASTPRSSVEDFPFDRVA